jgi:hypothetical protein
VCYGTFLEDRGKKHPHESAEKEDYSGEWNQYVEEVWSVSETIKDTQDRHQYGTGQ